MYFRLIMIANCSREKKTKDDINDLIRRKYDGLHFVHDLRFSPYTVTGIYGRNPGSCYTAKNVRIRRS
jgi:hypothetical protein